MLDLEKINLPIEHRTESMPGVVRHEIYTLGDLEYTEQYDDFTGQFVTGNVTMFGKIRVCTVYSDGSIMLTMPTGQVHDHKGMMMLVNDLKKLDEFLSIICENYNK